MRHYPEDLLDPDEVHGEQPLSPECHYCGDNKSELRVLEYDGYIPDELTCEECFSGADDGPYFDDLPLIDEQGRQ